MAHALLFIFPHNDITNVLTRCYGHPVLLLHRAVECQYLKVRKRQSDLQFLNACKVQNLAPNFLKFKVLSHEI